MLARRPVSSSLSLPAVSPEAGVGAALLLALALRVAAPGVFTDDRVAAWCTVFGALCLQAGPYVVLGAVLSAVVSAVPAGWVRRALPRRAVLAVPLAAAGAAAIPGCECGSVPLAAALMRRGVGTGPALAVMLSGPATNPVVLAATAAAFPGRPVVALARFLTSLSVAVSIGWLFAGAAVPPGAAQSSDHRHRPVEAVLEDLVRNLALLTVGAAAAASLTVFLPPRLLTGLGTHAIVGTLTLAVLAVLLGVCSVADAFLAASFTGFSAAAQLAFMAVGPVVDVKLIAMQTGTFGLRFAARVAATTFGCAVLCAAVWSVVLLR